MTLITHYLVTGIVVHAGRRIVEWTLLFRCERDIVVACVLDLPVVYVHYLLGSATNWAYPRIRFAVLRTFASTWRWCALNIGHEGVVTIWYLLAVLELALGWLLSSNSRWGANSTCCHWIRTLAVGVRTLASSNSRWGADTCSWILVGVRTFLLSTDSSSHWRWCALN